jgi:hypothetical protein
VMNPMEPFVFSDKIKYVFKTKTEPKMARPRRASSVQGVEPLKEQDLSSSAPTDGFTKYDIVL